MRRQRWARASALSRALSIRGCGGAGTASESMVLRPPRTVNVIGTCTVIVVWSLESIAFTRHPFFAPKPRASPGSGLLALRLLVPKTPSIGFVNPGESEHDCWMFAIAFLFVRVLCDCFKSRRRLESKILVLRHQLNVLQLRTPRRLYLTWIDRALFVWLYRGFPRILDAMHFGCATQRLPAARVSCRS